MRLRFDPGELRRTKAWELALRFVFGGVIAVCAGLVTHACGPTLGGLLLGFPAILPASLTLATQHHGRAEAGLLARGAQLGSVGLAAFALLAWATGRSWPAPLVLVAATLAWCAVSFAVWAAAQGLRRRGFWLRRASS